MMDEIDKNIEAFEEIQNELEKDSLGKWVVFYKQKHVGTFNTFEEASNEARSKFGEGPYLIREVGVNAITLPVSVLR